MIKILLAAALAIALGWSFHQYKVIEAQKREMRVQEIMFAKERHDLRLQLDDAKALAAIIERENKLALAEPPIGQIKLSDEKRPFGNRILMDVEPRSERTSLPQQKN